MAGNQKSVADWRKELVFRYVPEGIVITGCKQKNPSVLTIPGWIGKKQVAAVDNAAFRFLAVDEIVIEEGVKRIGRSAFWGSSVKKVTIPDSVALDPYVFCCCSNLADDAGDVVVRGIWFGNINHLYGFDEKPMRGGKAFHSENKIGYGLSHLPAMTWYGERPAVPEADLAGLKAGDRFCFGVFPGTKLAEMTPVEWIVVDSRKGCLHATPTKILTDYFYEENAQKINRWLRDVAADVMFTEKEKEKVRGMSVGFCPYSTDFTDFKRYQEFQNALEAARKNLSEYAAEQLHTTIGPRIPLRKPYVLQLELAV